MKRLRPAIACMGMLLPLLASCGSSTSLPFTVTCTTRKLPSGAIRANVTVSNTTSTAGKAFIYGPALNQVLHIFPVLRASEVEVTVGHSRQMYVGFLIPRITPQKPSRIILRLAPSRNPQTIVASGTRTVRASDWHVLDNSGCEIRRK